MTHHFYRRSFLNRRGFHGGAFVLADCRIDVFPGRGPDRYSVDASLTIADCGRTTTLDFCAADEAAARNALFKARLLRDVLVDFTAALEVTVEDWRERRG